MTPSAACKCVLVIDDDPLFCDAVRLHLAGPTVEVLAAGTGREGAAVCAARRVDVVLLDQRLPDGEGHTLCPQILKHNDQCKIIFITGYPNFAHAQQAVRAGAFDYLCKPFELEELSLAVAQAFRMLNLEGVGQFQQYRNRRDQEELAMIGEDGGMREIRELIRLSAEVEAAVLITGETGTGKNVAAQAIHLQSPRGDAPFVGINCAALPENLIEDELFGHEKGAFTGAHAARKGVFEIAEGGTLFLDEIGAMPLHLQAKLLGVLDTRRIKRLGGESVIPVDVRIVAATNSDLEALIRTREFREDLYYRLSVIRLHIPPLRRRRGDIPALCRHFIARIGGGRVAPPDEAEMDRLIQYDWPGNIRELRNVIERSLILQRDVLRPSVFLRPTAAPAAEEAPPPPERFTTLEERNRVYMQQVLDAHQGNLQRSAEVLGISLSTLKRKVQEYGLQRVSRLNDGSN